MRSVESTRRFARAYCKTQNIQMVVQPLMKVPHAIYQHGEKSFHMPLITSVNALEWARIAYHEIGHLDERNLWHYEVLERLHKLKGWMLRDIFGNIVDNMADRTGYSEYKGRARVLGEGRVDFLDKFVDMFKQQDVTEPTGLLRLALLIWDIKDREKWMHSFFAPQVKVNEYPHLIPYLQKIEATGISERVPAINEAQDVDACIKLLQDIDAILGDPSQKGNPEPQPQQGGDNAQKGEESADSSPSPNGSEEGEAAEEAQGGGSQKDQGDPAGDKDDPSSGEGEAAEQEVGDTSSGGSSSSGNSQSEQEGDQGMEQSVPESESTSGSDAGSSPDDTGRAEQNGQDSIVEKSGGGAPKSLSKEAVEVLNQYNQAMDRDLDKAANYREYLDKYERHYSSSYKPHAEFRVTKIKAGGDFKADRKAYILRLVAKSNLDRKVRRHLQLRSTGRVIHGVKRGRLSGKNLHKLYNRQAQAQPTIFKKEEFGKVDTDSACTMLIDFSGSMGTSPLAARYATACASAISFAEVLKGLRIRYEILGFTEHYQLFEMFLIKEFSERVLSKDQLAEKFSSYKIHQDHNADGVALQYTAERLMCVQERNKVLLVLSDGKPNDHCEGSGSWYLKQVIEDVEEHSPIHLAAIGIQSQHVLRFYKNSKKINDIEQLSEAVLDVLKTNLLTT